MNAIVWLLSQPLLWAGLGLGIGPFLFVRGFRLFQRHRLIMDIPRSTVRAAALGPVEISGKAVGPYTLVATLSHSDCLYYRIVVESRWRSNLPKSELCAPLYLDDGSGKLMIYPSGAELQIPASEGLDYPSAAMTVPSRSNGTSELSREYCIRPGDEIFVLGTLQENRWARKDPTIECSELSRIGPGFVSADEADLLQREALPILDRALPSRAAIAVPSEFDLHPSVILMKGAGPFVISTKSQREVVANLRWKSLLYIWGGPVAALWGLWEILSRVRAAGLLPWGF